MSGKKKKKGPKQNIESTHEVSCPFCENKERLRYMGAWHSPMFGIQCESTNMTLVGWGNRGREYFTERLKQDGYDVDAISDEMKAEMRKRFAPPEKKRKHPRDPEAEKIRLNAIRERKKIEKLGGVLEVLETPSDELTRVIAELRRDYG